MGLEYSVVVFGGDFKAQRVCNFYREEVVFVVFYCGYVVKGVGGGVGEVEFFRVKVLDVGYGKPVVSFLEIFAGVLQDLRGEWLVAVGVEVVYYSGG